MKQIIDYINSKFVRGDINRNDRLGALHRAWGFVFSNYIEGDYIEFGVFQGDSLVNSYKTYLLFKQWLEGQRKSLDPGRSAPALAYKASPMFYGLDTFAGMPDHQEDDKFYRPGVFQSDIDAVYKKCAAIGLTHLKLFKGLFAETGHLMESKQAAIINVDCDLYASTKDALAIAKPLINTGTVILMDDYQAFKGDRNRGGKRALREFTEETGKVFEPWFAYNYMGQAFITS